MPSRHHLLAAALLLAALCRPALAQVETREGIALQNQIAELRQELQMQQQARQGAGPQGYEPPPPYQPAPEPGAVGGGDTTAQLVVRVSALEEQNRALQGRVDDLTNQIQRQHDELTKQIGDLSFKLGQGAPSTDGGTSAPAPASPTLSAPARLTTPAAARRTPELSLREGNAALARRDYAAAAAAAHEALAGGHGATAASAQFLLARAEGGQRQYKQSAADYYQAYAHNPRAPAAPVALLGVANSLIAMGDNHDACQALSKLQAEFPSTSSVKAGAASARKRAACGR